MNRFFLKVTVSVLLLLAGAALLSTDTDREYINLQPSEGEPHGVVLESERTYAQTFIARRTTITRLGVFLRPAAPEDPDSELTLTIRHGESERIMPISTSLIDPEGSTFVRLQPPFRTAHGEPVTFALSVPPAASRTVRAQVRERDSTFDASNVVFTIDGAPQANPLAYQVYHRYQPSLAIQLGGLALLGASLVWLPLLPLYVLGASALFLAPALFLGERNMLLPYIFSAVALASLTALLREHGAGLVPALAGGHAFAFSTWFILHHTAGREPYALAAALPLLFLPKARRWAAVLLFFVVVVTLASWTAAPEKVFATAHPRDVFLDPNQTIAAIKVTAADGQPLSWSHFGSYLGPINVGLAVIGLMAHARQRRSLLIVGLIGGLAAFTTIARPHLVILLTFALAYFAGQGLQSLRQFLDPDPHRSDKVVAGLTAALALLALLDVWQVSALSLEYNVYAQL